MNSILSMSYDKNAFAISILRIFKIQFANNEQFNTVTFRIGVWNFYTTLSFSYVANSTFEQHGVS
tara:strand:- start:179 stop:373 length:195 start_codon:yes stop_codon:yes gene_type:complete